jgi:hypothetical protein
MLNRQTFLGVPITAQSIVDDDTWQEELMQVRS